MPNIDRCRNVLGRNGAWCALAALKEDRNGRAYFDRCLLCREPREDEAIKPAKTKDRYALLPTYDEHSLDYIYGSDAGLHDPFPNWTDKVAYENDTTHVTGLGFDAMIGSGIHRRPLRRRGDFWCPEEIHPEFHLDQVCFPFNPGPMDNDMMGDAYGTSEVAIISDSWADTRAVRIDRIQACSMSRVIRGYHRRGLSVVVPKCALAYRRSVHGWEDFVNGLKPVNLGIVVRYAAPKELAKYCIKILGDDERSHRIFEFLKMAKAGQFVPLGTLLINNGFPQRVIKKFIRGLCLKTKESLYGLDGYPKMNTDHLVGYFVALDKVYDNEMILHDVRSNVLNWIMNYPRLQNVDHDMPEIAKAMVDSIGGSKLKKKRGRIDRYPTDQRYWFLLGLLNRLIREGDEIEKLKEIEGQYRKKNGRPIVPFFTSDSEAPEWLVKMYDAYHKPTKVSLFGEDYILKSAPKQVQDDFWDAFQMRLDEPGELYAAQKRVQDILNPKLNTKANQKRYFVFSKIVLLGRRWNATELKEAWRKFMTAYNAKSPAEFWSWVQSLIGKDLQSVNESIPKNIVKIPKEQNPLCVYKGDQCNDRVTDEDGTTVRCTYSLSCPFKAIPEEDSYTGSDPYVRTEIESFSYERRFAKNIDDALTLGCITMNSFDIHFWPVDPQWGFLRSKGPAPDYDRRYGAVWLKLAEIGGLRADGLEDLSGLFDEPERTLSRQEAMQLGIDLELAGETEEDEGYD